MSYSNSYHASVPYSGYETVSYPASQNGGTKTVHYSGSVPIDVNIDVDTNPFDGSVKSFNSSVDILGGSIAAMKAAQCAAIAKTAQEVSAALINGFFGTINTELSQQLQALDSAIKALFGLIGQQGRAVEDKQNVMEGDYNRISSRYIRIFDDLDNECHKRIYALDKQSFNLSEKVQNRLLAERGSDTAAMNLLGIEEISSSKILILVSSLHRKVLEVLKTIRDYITQESRMNALVNSLLFNEDAGGILPVRVPVIWAESDMLESGDAEQECFIAGYIDTRGKQEITGKVKRFCSGVPHNAWKRLENEGKKSLDREFNALTETCFTGASDETQLRVYRTMQTLWQNAELFSLERSL